MNLDVVVCILPLDAPWAPRAAAIATAQGLRCQQDSSAARIVVIAEDAGAFGRKAIVIGDQPDPRAWDTIPADALATRLPAALRNLVEHERLRHRLADAEVACAYLESQLHDELETVEALNNIGRALSAEVNPGALMAELLRIARRMLCADGGSIYLRIGDQLVFAAAQNDTVLDFSGPPGRVRLPIDDSSIAGFVAHHNAVLNIPDVQNLPTDTPYRFNGTFDRAYQYITRSMLLVPLVSREGDNLGVLALINRKPDPDAPLRDYRVVLPFDSRQVALARSIASQASVALENHALYREIRTLFEGFVEAAVQAIESRDPVTSGHSRRVADLTLILAEEIHDRDDPPFYGVRFEARELVELKYAALLHDFGKVAVREEVLLKANRLLDWEFAEIEARFQLAALELSIVQAWAPDGLPVVEALQRDLAFLRHLNDANRMVGEPERVALLERLRWWEVRLGRALLRPREIERLCIRSGSLDPEERQEINRHVEHTWRFLSTIPWGRTFCNVPHLAYAHHEKLDGSGYPRRLTAPQIPLGARLMTIADIFDALTAPDRPYKRRFTLDEALKILREEADRGKLYTPAVELLIDQQLWTRRPKTG